MMKLCGIKFKPPLLYSPAIITYDNTYYTILNKQVIKFKAEGVPESFSLGYFYCQAYSFLEILVTYY